jgi:hypothetical protein
MLIPKMDFVLRQESGRKASLDPQNRKSGKMLRMLWLVTVLRKESHFDRVEN